VQHFAELMVKINATGNFAATELMLHHFVDHIYPRILMVKDEETTYATSVIASQGLIIAAAKNKPQIGDLVFAQLLGKDFDIRQHKNATLIYNLACYQAIQSNKPAMLEAIRQARLRGKPAQQFMRDTDFQKYWTDADFVTALQ
jgi:hypothetical protein